MAGRYITRSHRLKDEKCPRARYWWTFYEGRGIERVGEAYALSFGTIVHAALAGLLDPDDPQHVEGVVVEARNALLEVLGRGAELATDSKDFLAVPDPKGLILIAPGDEASLRVAEQVTLLEGLIRGFHKVVMPRILDQYDVVSIEREYVIPLGEGIDFGTKPDLILRRKFDRTLWYMEYKTTSSLTPQWFRQWTKNVQLMAGAKAVGDTLGEPFEGCVVQALYKGANYQNSLTSPLVYVWRKPGGPGESDEVVGARPTKWAGWKREGIWEEIGIKAWIEAIPEEVLAGQFPSSEPIFLQPELIERFLRQALYRELKLETARTALDDSPDGEPREKIMDHFFPQCFGQCEPGWGYPCEYTDCCWLPHVEENPLASGLYRVREFHHQEEARRFEEERHDME